MIRNVSVDEIENAVKIHWKLQLGSYFDSIHDLDGAVYNLGDLVTDYYWNYAGMINTNSNVANDLVTRIMEFAKKHPRDPAFYIDPSTRPNNFTDYLTTAGFKPDDDEIWMFFNEFPSQLKQQPLNLEIREVFSLEDMTIFVDIFHEAYEMLEDGETSSTYGDSLMKAYQNQKNNVNVHHFIGSRSGEPVCVSSIYISGHDAGLYNVGTPKAHRGGGIGTALSVHAINFAKNKGVNKIILQTELASDAERLYKNLGFSQAFSAAIWVKEKK